MLKVSRRFPGYLTLKNLSLSPYFEQPNNQKLKLQAVLWIRIGFNADPDPDPGYTFSSLKGEFLHELYTFCTIDNSS
jgi:hypothetical protein